MYHPFNPKCRKLLAQISGFKQAGHLFRRGLEMEISPIQPDNHHFFSEEMRDNTEENQWRF